jgi:hypothetical protein
MAGDAHGREGTPLRPPKADISKQIDNSYIFMLIFLRGLDKIETVAPERRPWRNRK